jgi:hypothetical protein
MFPREFKNYGWVVLEWLVFADGVVGWEGATECDCIEALDIIIIIIIIIIIMIIIIIIIIIYYIYMPWRSSFLRDLEVIVLVQ